MDNYFARPVEGIRLTRDGIPVAMGRRGVVTIPEGGGDSLTLEAPGFLSLALPDLEALPDSVVLRGNCTLVGRIETPPDVRFPSDGLQVTLSQGGRVFYCPPTWDPVFTLPSVPGDRVYQVDVRAEGFLASSAPVLVRTPIEGGEVKCALAVVPAGELVIHSSAAVVESSCRLRIHRGSWRTDLPIDRMVLERSVPAGPSLALEVEHCGERIWSDSFDIAPFESTEVEIPDLNLARVELDVVDPSESPLAGCAVFTPTGQFLGVTDERGRCSVAREGVASIVVVRFPVEIAVEVPEGASHLQVHLDAPAPGAIQLVGAHPGDRVEWEVPEEQLTSPALVQFLRRAGSNLGTRVAEAQGDIVTLSDLPPFLYHVRVWTAQGRQRFAEGVLVSEGTMSQVEVEPIAEGRLVVDLPPRWVPSSIELHEMGGTGVRSTSRTGDRERSRFEVPTGVWRVTVSALGRDGWVYSEDVTVVAEGEGGVTVPDSTGTVRFPGGRTLSYERVGAQGQCRVPFSEMPQEIELPVGRYLVYDATPFREFLVVEGGRTDLCTVADDGLGMGEEVLLSLSTNGTPQAVVLTGPGEECGMAVGQPRGESWAVSGPLASGRYRVIAWRGGECAMGFVELPAAKATKVELGSSVLEGRVSSESGEALAFCPVVLQSRMGGAAGVLRFSAVSRRDGSFSFGRIPRGEYELIANSSRIALQVSSHHEWVDCVSSVR